MRARPAREACTGRRMQSYACGGRSTRGLQGHRPGSTRALPVRECAVFANEQFQVRALLVSEFQEDLLALGVFETLAVTFEKLVRAALALDPDQQCLLIVDTLAKFRRPFIEKPVGGSLEKKERRPG